MKSNCVRFSWGRINFLHNIWYRAVFWIVSVDNSGMTLVLLSRGWGAKPLPAPHPTHQRERGWGCPRGWEGTPPGQLTPTHPGDVPDQI